MTKRRSDSTRSVVFLLSSYISFFCTRFCTVTRLDFDVNSAFRLKSSSSWFTLFWSPVFSRKRVRGISVTLATAVSSSAGSIASSYWISAKE